MDSPISNMKKYQSLMLKSINKTKIKPNIQYTAKKINRHKPLFTSQAKMDYSFSHNKRGANKTKNSYCHTEVSDYVKLPFLPRYHQSSQVVATPLIIKENKLSSLQLTESYASSKRVFPKKPIEPKYRCSAKSQAGQRSDGNKKVNQDSFLLMCNVFKTSFNFIIGVFDGHGANGHLVSQFIKKFFNNYFTSPECLLIFRKYINYPTYHKTTFNSSIKTLFLAAEDELRKKGFDSIKSGTTAVIIASYGDKIICLNVGDSRAIYINDKGEPHQISKDHKPNDPNEKNRINTSGGIVVCDDNQTHRVYFSNEYEPGLAVSRSIGDFDSKRAGIISEPEITYLSIGDNGIKVIIVGSDGLWDCFSNEEVRDIITPFIQEKDSSMASKELLEKAREVWTENSNNYIDDITAIVLFI